MSREGQGAGPVVHRSGEFGWLLPYVSALLAFALLSAGLLLVRWIGTSTGLSATTRVAAPRATPIPFSTIVSPSPGADREPIEEIDLEAAYDEAMGVAYPALLADDLETALLAFYLATQAMPDDPEATDRLRQVEIARGIEERRTNWDEAMEELAELRSVVPTASKVVEAHVTALVAVGREALERNNRIRAAVLCGEAVRSLPTRTDARTCLTAAGGFPGIPFTPAPTPLPGLVRPNTPTPAPTPTLVR